MDAQRRLTKYKHEVSSLGPFFAAFMAESFTIVVHYCITVIVCTFKKRTRSRVLVQTSFRDVFFYLS